MNCADAKLFFKKVRISDYQRFGGRISLLPEEDEDFEDFWEPLVQLRNQMEGEDDIIDFTDFVRFDHIARTLFNELMLT